MALGQTKLGDLCRRAGSFGVYSNAVHPGVVASDSLVCKAVLC